MDPKVNSNERAPCARQKNSIITECRGEEVPVLDTTQPVPVPLVKVCTATIAWQADAPDHPAVTLPTSSVCSADDAAIALAVILAGMLKSAKE